MKRHLIGVVLIAALGTAPAVAADMAFKAAAVPVPVWTWTGFYVGGNVGYSWGPWSSTNTAGNTNFPTGTGFTNTASPQVDGWLGGLQAGYNWQTGQWVFGLEGDIQITSQSASDPGSASTVVAISPCPPVALACPGTDTTTTSVTNNWKMPWFSTLRGRVGVTADPTLLLYATGGLAIAGTQYANSNSVTTVITVPAPGTTSTSVSSWSQATTRVGFAVGGGVEKMLSPNWSVKGEYLFLGLGSYTFLSGTGADTNVKMLDNIVRLGLNYKFGG
jgi:outer membrane immunogenic protein